MNGQLKRAKRRVKKVITGKDTSCYMKPSLVAEASRFVRKKKLEKAPELIGLSRVINFEKNKRKDAFEVNSLTGLIHEDYYTIHACAQQLWTICPELENTPYCLDKYGRKVKIFKPLMRLMMEKITNQFAWEHCKVTGRQPIYAPVFWPIDTYKKWEERVLKFLQAFVVLREEVIISTRPNDFLRMSASKHYTSCLRFGHKQDLARVNKKTKEFGIHAEDALRYAEAPDTMVIFTRDKGGDMTSRMVVTLGKLAWHPKAQKYYDHRREFVKELGYSAEFNVVSSKFFEPVLCMGRAYTSGNFREEMFYEVVQKISPYRISYTYNECLVALTGRLDRYNSTKLLWYDTSMNTNNRYTDLMRTMDRFIIDGVQQTVYSYDYNRLETIETYKDRLKKHNIVVPEKLKAFYKTVGVEL